MKTKRKKQDPLVEYIKANRIHVSKKVYNRKRMKADAQRHLPYLFLVA